MTCPNCHVEMKKVKTLSHYGIAVELDQCPECGGIWFESDELYYVRKGEASNFDEVDSEKLKKLIKLEEKLYCPKDNTELRVYQDPLFPVSIKVEFCTQCGGFWFNRGEFKVFQTEREKRELAMKAEMDGRTRSDEDKKFNEQISKLLNTGSQSNTYNALGQFGKMLNKPVYLKNNNILDFGINDANGSRDYEDIAFTAWGIIRILLRLLIKL
jgi:uncharacterized protein